MKKLIIIAGTVLMILTDVSAQSDTLRGTRQPNPQRNFHTNTNPNGNYNNTINMGNTMLGGTTTNPVTWPKGNFNNRTDIYNTTTTPPGAINQNGTINTRPDNSNTPPYNNGTNGTGSNSSNVINR